ncbi:hypothetical protein ZMO1_ZMO0397 [Zymomonas mobilis subsp. mobilis ZM4 = ATCC 31821]|uniref:Uncharacterized protein n=2 Tax=Zymomonas mobilis subsp. mobilis TaxID=120045 RepID=Q5NQI3_ZYMMO|nr:hypothetical protein [Zymomonas mobilis]AAV89021.1 conserved hypothetical protein [Zymomonas mobilis subsp. mobilis ZM4 = ATCC 31821]AEH62769.1 conserved hypothetical protein [Zymomonas mobilis subsp. mobilis ATCC 10988]AHB10178.1 hypothetical protein ZCP4_0877 [Zymomonas mobilis subsp. mobilis str. CP4 = NRRL B-14023]AHJ70485.1 hypothetical protein A254_00867 [Zymomonas mobilis subsp. mobilis NRRL B-12526]AHJ72340.1 hypothetical protein A265_00867 [Zymomonas mobilis subsp. mobilis str. CP4
MTISLKDQDNFSREIRAVSIRGADGVLHSVGSIRIRGQDESLHEVFCHKLDVSVSDALIESYSRHNPVISSAVTVQVSGGVPPYQHRWSLVSSDRADSVMALSPFSATTTFRADGVPHHHAASAYLRDDVTDQNGFAGSVEVHCIFTR